MKTCKGCGADIRWIKTEAGKSMPVNADPVGVYVLCSEQYKRISGYLPHWVSCPKAKQFKRAARKKVKDGNIFGN